MDVIEDLKKSLLIDMRSGATIKVYLPNDEVLTGTVVGFSGENFTLKTKDGVVTRELESIVAFQDV